MSDSNDDTAESGESDAAASDESEAAGSDESEAAGSDESEAPGSDESEAPGSDESVAASAGIDADVIDAPRHLERRVRIQWVVRSVFGAAVLGVIAAVVAYIVGLETRLFDSDPTTAAAVGVAVFALFALFGVVRAVLLYRSWEYVVRADSLYLSRGVFTRVRTVVPYVRVQHIDTTRNPFERVLGLSTLVVYTAGSRGADVTIPGLTPDRASTLQSRLKRLAIESEEEDAV